MQKSKDLLQVWKYKSETKTPGQILTGSFLHEKIAVTGFEPATSSSLTKRSTKLSHTTIPKAIIAQSFFLENP